jgi:hypothetical protein
MKSNPIASLFLKSNEVLLISILTSEEKEDSTKDLEKQKDGLAFEAF